MGPKLTLNQERNREIKRTKEAIPTIRSVWVSFVASNFTCEPAGAAAGAPAGDPAAVAPAGAAAKAAPQPGQSAVPSADSV